VVLDAGSRPRLELDGFAGLPTIVDRWDDPASIARRAAPARICADDDAGGPRRPLTGRARLAELIAALDRRAAVTIAPAVPRATRRPD
jgi:hypothetical protein